MVSDRFTDAYVPEMVSRDDLQHFDRGGYGARMGWGEEPAVIVVDMVELFASSDHLGRSDESMDAVSATEQLLKTARDVGVPIYYTRLADQESTFAAHRGIVDMKKEGDSAGLDLSAASTIIPQIAPEPHDVILEKPKLSAFFDTHLAAMLRHEGIDTVVIAGLSTSGGIRSTVVDANSHNFRPIIPFECVSDRADISHEMALFDIDMKFGDVTPLNAVLDQLTNHAK